MEKETFEDIRNSGRLLYEYIRGSHAYGLNVETSDVDTGGVYITTPDVLRGLRVNYLEQISDKKGDNVWYEIGRFLELLMTSNPNMLEALFVPERCIIYKHPVMDVILKNRKKFLCKKVFKALSGYSYDQIQKARGLNKKITKPIKYRQNVIDFCWTFDGCQGSMRLIDWLNAHGMKQKYCGLTSIDNMPGVYGLYYDFGQHIHGEYPTPKSFVDFLLKGDKETFMNTVKEFDFSLYMKIQMVLSEYREDPKREEHISKYNKELKDIYKRTLPLGYHGIMNEDGSSNEVRVDPVEKEARPITFISYNDSAYKCHCREYKEYKDWEKNRNPARYESNLEKNYDSKNVMHCLRLMQMGIELATTGEFNIDRVPMGDREFLLDVRNHKYEYDYLVKLADEKKALMDKLAEECDLPDEIDRDVINELLIEIRHVYEDNK